MPVCFQGAHAPSLIACLAALWVLAAPPLRSEVVTTPAAELGLGSVTVLAASPDGRWLATGGQAGAFVWDATSGTLHHRFTSARTKVTAAAFSPDSRLLVTAGGDGTIRAWEMATGGTAGTWTGHRAEINSLRFGPDGRTFLTASGDNTARLWSLDTPEMVREFRLRGSWFTDALFDGTGARVITFQGMPAPEPHIWDAATGKLSSKLVGHTGEVRRGTLLPGGRLATAGSDLILRIWDLSTGVEERTLPLERLEATALFTTSDASRLVAGLADGVIRSWNLSDFAEVPVAPQPGVVLQAVTPAARPRQLFVAGTDYRVVLRNLDDHAILQTFEGHHSATLLGVVFSPDGRTLYAGGVQEDSLGWEIGTGRILRRFAGHPSGTGSTALTADGAWLATTVGVPRPAVQLWDARSGELRRELIGHPGWVLDAQFSPDGALIASAAQDATVRIWETATGRWLRTLSGHVGSVNAVAFSPDGSLVATGGFDESLVIWEVATGAARHRLEAPGAAIKAVAWAPDGQEVAAGSENAVVRFWSPETGESRGEWTIPSGYLNDLAYSPGGGWLATAEGWPTFTARLWERRTGRVLRVFAGQTSPVEALAFAPDGLSLATAADTLRIWELTDVAARVEIAREAGRSVVRWSLGVLQQAADPAGPWRDVPGAASPWEVPVDTQAAVFRVRVPAP